MIPGVWNAVGLGLRQSQLREGIAQPVNGCAKTHEPFIFLFFTTFRGVLGLLFSCTGFRSFAATALSVSFFALFSIVPVTIQRMPVHCNPLFGSPLIHPVILKNTAY